MRPHCYTPDFMSDFSAIAYQRQLTQKIERIEQLFSDFELPSIAVFDSPPTGFRMRAEFRIWHQDDRAHYAMNRPGEKQPYIIPAEFPIASHTINQLMPPLLEAINSSQVLSHRLFSMEYLTTTTGEALVTLIYHRPLNADWEKEASDLQDQFGIAVIGRSRKQKIVLSRDYVDERLQVDGAEYSFR